MLPMPQISTSKTQKYQPCGAIKMEVLINKISTNVLVMEIIQFLSGEPTDRLTMTSLEPQLYHEK